MFNISPFASFTRFLFVLALLVLPASADAVTIYLTSGSSWTVPSDWSNSGAVIEVIGGGGGGGEGGFYYGAGGGGGAYARRTSGISLSPGQAVSYQIGAGGVGGVVDYAQYNQAPTDGGDTWFVSPSVVLAKGGTNGGTTPYGGQAGASVGDVAYSGGNGAGPTHNEDYSDVSGGGGGGAAGPNGAGGAGANGVSGNFLYPWYTDGGTGDANSGGGAGSGGWCPNGPGSYDCNQVASSPGGNGAEWGPYGSGGGGGGANYYVAGSAGNGGYYGGGGGGGGYNMNGYGNNGGSGAPGIIRITYTSDACPTPIESYWGAGNYLFWASATRRINAVGINTCVRNNTGSHYFVPGRTSAELQSFINAAGRLGVSIF